MFGLFVFSASVAKKWLSKPNEENLKKMSQVGHKCSLERNKPRLVEDSAISVSIFNFSPKSQLPS